MAELNIDGETFKVDMAGEATRPAVLLAHALGSDLTMWDGQMEALSRQFRVVRYDARGHGASERVERPVSLAELGRDALAIMDALEIETAHFIGVSMGGAVGQWLLINAPHRIDRAVLANTAAKLGTPEMWNTRISAAINGGMTGNADVTIGRWFSPDFVERKAGRVEAIRDVLLGCDPVGYAACCAALRDMDLREALKTIDRPVLVVTGTDDPINSAEDLALLLARIEGAAHVALSARHIANIEAESAFNSAVGDFLTAKRSRPKTPPKPARAPLPASSRVERQKARRAGVAARSPLRRTIKAGMPIKNTAAKPSTPQATSKSSKSSHPKVEPRGAKTVARTAGSKASTAPVRVKAAGKAEGTRGGLGSAKTIASARQATPKPVATASKLKAGKTTTSSKATAVKTSAAKAGIEKTGKPKASTGKANTAKASASKASASKASASKASASKASASKASASKASASKASKAKAGPTKSAASKAASPKSGASTARLGSRKVVAAKPVAAKASRQPAAKAAKATAAPKKLALTRGGVKSAATKPVSAKSQRMASPPVSRKPAGTPRRTAGRNRT